MAASKSSPGLLSAIEGYSAEHAGSPQHESNIALLQRVKGEIAKGHGGDTISPGQREASSAAQKNMPAEENHSGGEGNKTTNAPGSGFPKSEPVADIQADGTGHDVAISGGPEPSDGQVHSNLSGPAAASGKLPDMRRQAALKDLEKGPTSEGNKESNPPGKAGANDKRIGDVETNGKEPPDKNKGDDGFEGVPPFAKESLSGDGWTRANAKAKQMYAAKK
jgi:hypothetical protein